MQQRKWELELQHQQTLEELKKVRIEAENAILFFTNASMNKPHDKKGVDKRLALELQKAMIDLDTERKSSIDILNRTQATINKHAENQKIANEKIKELEYNRKQGEPEMDAIRERLKNSEKKRSETSNVNVKELENKIRYLEKIHKSTMDGMTTSANQAAGTDWDHKLWNKIVALYELDIAEPQFCREIIQELEQTSITKTRNKATVRWNKNTKSHT